MHGPIRRPQHSFAPDWEAADADLARMLGNRRKRNEACANARHVPGTCDECKRDREDAERAALRTRFRAAERAATQVLDRGANPKRMWATFDVREPAPPPVPDMTTALVAIAIALCVRR